MKIEKTVCPYCGANLKIRPGQASVECEYCRSSVLISDTKSASPKTAPAKEAASPEAGHPAGAVGNSEPVRTQPSAKHALFHPPGFRKKNILHMITAVCGYLFILYVALYLDNVLEFIFFTVASLSVVDICTDWTGLFSGLAGVRSRNRLTRILMKTIWSMVVFTAWVFLMAIVQAVFHL